MKHFLSFLSLFFILNSFTYNLDALLDKKHIIRTNKQKIAYANELLKAGNHFFNGWEPEKALACFTTILEFLPQTAAAYHNIGLCLAYRYGDFESAILAYETALQLKPDDGETHFCNAIAHLALGDFKHGFAEHEWRWKGRKRARNRDFPYPLPNQWNGEDVEGKRIVIRAEQGLGDVMQFSRYMQLLKQEGAYIIFEVPPPLYDLFSLVDWIDEFMPVDGQLPEHDYQITLMSLPFVFNTRVHTVPQNIPYLKAKPELIDFWHNHFDHKKFNIGICWHGEPISGPMKFMPLADFAQLSTLPNVALHSVQRVDGLDQINDLPDNVHVHTFGPDFDRDHGRFMDTAAVMHHMDLIITIDTSIAHLAGALGRPTWVVLPFPAEWRWMTNRDDSPWYPTMKLFRQTVPGHWNDVLKQLKQNLGPLIVHKMSTTSVVAEVSVGELIDKITILRLKQKKIDNPEKLININNELHSLEFTKNSLVPESSTLDVLIENLYETNKALWEIEDDIRDKERDKSFDETFIKLARSVYLTNDQRCAIKRQINMLLGSQLIEEKSYKKYV